MQSIRFVVCGLMLAFGLSACQTQSYPSLVPASTQVNQGSLVSQGRAVLGAEIKTYSEQGQPLTLKIHDVDVDPTDLEQEIYLYTVLYEVKPQEKGIPQWQNLCLPDADGVAKAIPLSGRWGATGDHIDDGGITFDCTKGVLAKCVRWGYKPWKTEQGQSLRDFHQACTRMARADYCGDGTGHTQNGTPIDIYDRLQIQTLTSNSGMVFEAAWGPDGAVLLHRPRWQNTLTQLQQDCPDTLAQIFVPSAESLSVEALQEQYPEALLFNDSLDQSL